MNMTEESPGVITLTRDEAARANVSTTVAAFRPIFQSKNMLGRAAVNENNLSVISARIAGRVERLYIRTVGEYVSRGQVLYSIYSEELLADQNSYLNALLKNNGPTSIQQELVSSALSRLRLWGMSDPQIEKIAREGKPLREIEFSSDIAGTVLQVNIIEGTNVSFGTPLFTIANLTNIWVEAQLYSDDIAEVRPDNPVDIRFDGFPTEIFSGTIIDVLPVIEKNKNYTIARILFKNSKGKIHPGMLAYVTVKTNKKDALVIPKSAIIRAAKTTVWIQNQRGGYEARDVVTGVENEEYVEIISGINPGERVVSSGAYLINSQLILNKGGKSHNH